MRAAADRKLIFSFLLMIISIVPIQLFSQTINSESFDATAFPPPGWTRTGGFGSQWVRVTNSNNPPVTPHSGAGMARFTVNNQQPGSQETLTTPVVDLAGSSGSTPTFSLWVYREGSSTAGDSITIFINTTNSVTGATRIGGVARSRFFVLPVNEPSDGWYQYSFNVPSTFNTDTNYFLIRGIARGGENMFIDDVQWDEYAVACAGPPDAGNALATDTLICGGSGDADLSLDGTSVTFGGINFQWQNGPSNTGPWTDFGPNASTTNTGVLTMSTYFRCIVTCGPTMDSDTSTVVYVAVSPNAAPNVTLNPGQTQNYCTGDTPISLVASGASFYTWTPNIAINAVGDSALAAPSNTTTYTVVGSDSSGCSDVTSIIVNVGSSPNVTASTNNDTICSGQSTNLNAQVQGPPFGLQFTWTPGPLNGPNVMVSPTTTTTYVVSVTSTFNACPGHDTLTIEVLPAPTAGYTFVANNLVLTFTDNSSGTNLTYLWNFGDGTTDTTQNPVHTYNAIGIYTVTLTVSDGTCSNTYTQVITVGNVGLASLNDGSPLILYPNPVLDDLYVEFIAQDSPLTINVVDQLGHTVASYKAQYSQGEKVKYLIPSASLAAGLYQLHIFNNTNNTSLRFIKK